LKLYSWGVNLQSKKPSQSLHRKMLLKKRGVVGVESLIHSKITFSSVTSKESAEMYSAA